MERPEQHVRRHRVRFPDERARFTLKIPLKGEAWQDLTPPPEFIEIIYYDPEEGEAGADERGGTEEHRPDEQPLGQ